MAVEGRGNFQDEFRSGVNTICLWIMEGVGKKTRRMLTEFLAWETEKMAKACTEMGEIEGRNMFRRERKRIYSTCFRQVKFEEPSPKTQSLIRMIHWTLGTQGKGWRLLRDKRLHVGYGVHCSGDGCTEISEITTEELIHVTKHHLIPKTY